MNSSKEFRPINPEKLPEISPGSARNRNDKGQLMINTRPERIGPTLSDKSLTRLSREGKRGEMTPGSDGGYPRDLDFRPQRPSLTKEISSGISNMEMSERMRDLERKFIDLSSSMDRRIQGFIEENPQKILRHLKASEEKDAMLWKESHKRQTNFQDTINQQRDNLKDNLDSINQALITLNRRVDESEYKVGTMERGVEQINKLKTNNLLQIENKPAGGGSNEQVDTELRLLREAVNQERQKREVFFADVMKQYQEVFSFVHKSEGDLLGRLQKHKDETQEQNRTTKEQQKRLEDMKVEKLLGDNEYIKNIHKMLENKVDEEVSKRLRHEFENKQWMEHKLGTFKDEIRSDEKDMLESDKKFAEQMHDSIGSLNQIVKNTKEQLEANIASTQTIFNENVKSISETVNLLKENVYSKLNVMDVSQKDLQQKIQETNSHFHNHSQSVNEMMDKEFQRIEQVTIKFEEILNNKIEGQNEKIDQSDAKTEQWRKEFEEKNLKVLTEIGNALKSVKNELSKEKDETLQRFERTKDEMSNMRMTTDKLKLQTDEHVENLQIQFNHKTEEILVKTTEQLNVTADQIREEIEKMGRSTYEKSSKDTKLGLLNLDQKITNNTKELVTQTSNEIYDRMAGDKQLLMTELRNNTETLRKSVADLKEEKNRDVDDLYTEMRTLRKDTETMRLEFNERLKDQMLKFESQIKTASENLRVHVTERLNQYKGEVDQEFERQAERFKEDLNIAQEQNKKLLNQLYDRLRGELSKELQRLDDKFWELIEEERKIRAERDAEQAKQLQAVKNMLMETINTKIESTQALARALVNEEAAERAKADEQLYRTLQTQIKSMEEFLTSLIQRTAEELRLEFDDKLRKLESKLEQFKIWTVGEINKLVDDLEDYAHHVAAKFHVLELQLRAEAQATVENFKKVADEIHRLDIQRDNDMQWVESEFERVEKQRVEDLKRIAEKFKKIKESFQQAVEQINNKINEIEENRKKELEKIQEKFNEMEQQRKEDLQKLEEEIEERRKKNEEYEKVMAEHKQSLEEHKESLEKHEKQIQETKDALDNAVKKIKEEIAKEIKELEEGLDEVDEKFTHAIDDLNIKMQVKDYLDGLYRKAKEAEDAGNQAENKKKFQKYDEQFKAAAERFEDVQDQIETFEEKTENNFKIAEEMLLSHSNYLAALDGRLTAEELFSRVTMANLEERVAMEFAQLETMVNLLPDELQGKFEKRIGELQRLIQEDIIPSTILKMNEALGEARNQMGSEASELKNFMAQRLSDHEKTLITHTALLNSHDQRVEFLEENLDAVSEILQKYAQRLDTNEQEHEKSKGELYVAVESKFQTLAALQKAIDANVLNVVKEIFGDLENTMMSSQKAGVGAGQLNEIKSTIIPDIKACIQSDVPDIIQSQVPNMIDAKISKYQQTQKPHEGAEQQPQGRENAAGPKAGQEEVDAMNEKMTKLETKITDEVSAKIGDLETRYQQLEKKVREGGSGGSGNQDQQGNPQINEEVKEELRKFKEIIDEIQKEQKEKDKQTDDMNRKLDNVNDNIKGIENTIKEQMQDATQQQSSNQKVVTDQLGRLFDQFQNLQDKLYVDKDK